MRNDVSLLVHTFDGYQQFWGGMLYTLDFYWDFDRIPVYFSSENVPVDSLRINCKGIDYTVDKRIIPILTGKGEFSDRFIKSIESIDSEWIIYIQEDMWLRSHLDPELVDELIDEARSQGADAIKVHAVLYYYDKYFLERTGRKVRGKDVLRYSQGDNFLLTHNATIWKKSYILEHQREGENPWDNEINGSLRMSSGEHNQLHYNINWYCQPGVCAKGEPSLEFHTYAHLVDHMKFLDLNFSN
jgi:hypothetical protein